MSGFQTGFQAGAPVAGPEQSYYRWKAERDQMKDRHIASMVKLDRQFDEERVRIHEEFETSQRAMSSGVPASPFMSEYLDDRRTKELRKMQQIYTSKRQELEATYEKDQQAHMESFVQRMDASMMVANTVSESTNRPALAPLSNTLPGSGVHSQFSSSQLDNRQHVRTQLHYNMPAPGRYEPANVQPPKYWKAPTEAPPIQGPPNFVSSFKTQAGMDVTPNLPPQATAQQSHPNPSAGFRQSTSGHSTHPLGYPTVLPSQPFPPSFPPNASAPPGPPGYERGPGQDVLKRKAEFEPSPAMEGVPKRVRSASVAGREREPVVRQDSDEFMNATAARPWPAPKKQKTISFDEVYQDGAPEHQAYHMIIEYPPGKGDWFILKCDEHGVYFNANPLHGAAKHLHSPQHNMMSKEHSVAIAELGHIVFDCDAQMAAKNNAMVKKYFDSGNRPFNQNQLTKTERARRGLEPLGAGSPRPPQAPRDGNGRVPRVDMGRAGPGGKSFSGITYPVPGELYLGYWSKNKTNYGVIVLPWNDLAAAGIQSRLKSTGLLERAPKCYRLTRNGEIEGWAEGYEDGGPLITRRDFPVMYYDGHRSVGWMRAKDLSSFPFDGGDPHLIPFFHEARDSYAALRGYENYQHLISDYRQRNLPGKKSSEVGGPAQTSEADAVRSGSDQAGYYPVDNVDELVSPKVKGRKPEEGPAETGNADVPDVDMPDVSHVDEDSTNSGPDLGLRDLLGVDCDVEMANTDSRRTSVSHSKTEHDSKRPASALKNGEEALQTTARSTAPTGGDGSRETTHAELLHNDEVSAQMREEVPAVDHTPQEGLPNPQSLKSHVEERLEVDASTGDGPAEHSADARPQSTLSPDMKRAEQLDARTKRAPSPARVGSPAVAHISPAGKSLAGCSAENEVDAPSRKATPVSSSSSLSPPISSPPAEDTVIYKASPLLDNGANASASPALPKDSSKSVESERPTAPPPDEPLSSPPIAASIEAATSTSVPDEPTNCKVIPTRSISDNQEQQGKSDRRSKSPPTIETVSNSGTRKSTPTVTRPDDIGQGNRWRAVRSESTAQNIASDESFPNPATVSKTRSLPPSLEPSRDRPGVPRADTVSIAGSTGSTSPVPTANDMPKPGGKEEYFEVAWYENSDGVSFSREKDISSLVMVTNSQTSLVQSSTRQAVEVTIDPNATDSMTVEPLDSMSETVMVTLLLKKGAGGPVEQKLVFETSKITGIEAIGRIQARRFCHWLNRHRNSAHVIRYVNKSHDPLRKLATSFTL